MQMIIKIRASHSLQFFIHLFFKAKLKNGELIGVDLTNVKGLNYKNTIYPQRNLIVI